MKLHIIVGCLIGFLVIGNCANPATKEGMITKDFESRKKIGESIFIEKTTGGSKTNPFLISKISSEELNIAIQDSIKESKLFTRLVGEETEDWRLKSEIIKQDQPYFSFNTNCKVSVKYSVYKSNRLVREFIIEETGSSSLRDSLRPIKRVQIANENAARANIHKLLEELAKI